MLQPKFTKAFQKDFKRSQRRGKDLEKLHHVQKLLTMEEALPAQYRDHPLKGVWAGHRECHIEPDWLLIYRIHDLDIIFTRIGTHSDLFDE